MYMKKIAAVSLLAGLLFLFNVQAQNKADGISGTWLTTGENAAKIYIYNSGGRFYGKIIWLKNPMINGKQILDGNNPDKKKRSNPVIGLVILTGFKFDGDDEWTDGDIYDPVSGKTYSAYMYLKDKHTLKIRGYIGISLFGRTETWTRTN